MEGTMEALNELASSFAQRIKGGGTTQYKLIYINTYTAVVLFGQTSLGVSVERERALIFNIARPFYNLLCLKVVLGGLNS